MRAVRSDVFRETHQSSRSRDKIGQGKVYYRDTECITKLYLGSRMTDADKKKIERSPCATGTSSPAPRGGLYPTRRYAGVPHCINTAMRQTRDLTDEHWKTLDPLIPKPRRRRDGRGRPWKSRRSVLNGVLWVLRTDAPWADLPDRYPSFQTCHSAFSNGFPLV